MPMQRRYVTAPYPIHDGGRIVTDPTDFERFFTDDIIDQVTVRWESLNACYRLVYDLINDPDDDFGAAPRNLDDAEVRRELRNRMIGLFSPAFLPEGNPSGVIVGDRLCVVASVAGNDTDSDSDFFDLVRDADTLGLFNPTFDELPTPYLDTIGLSETVGHKVFARTVSHLVWDVTRSSEQTFGDNLTRLRDRINLILNGDLVVDRETLNVRIP